MTYLRRIIQATVLLGIIWLTIQNYEVKVDLKLFTKEITEASVILVVFFAVLFGILLSTFFSAMKDFRNLRAYNKSKKENKKLNKKIESLEKDVLIQKNDLDSTKRSNELLEKEISTLKEVIKFPTAIEGNNSKETSMNDASYHKLLS